MLAIPETLAQAKELHRQGHVEQAAGFYRQILAIDSGQTEAAYLLGIACQALGQLDEAVATLQHAARLQPESPEIAAQLRQTIVMQHHHRSGELAATGQLAAATDCYRKIVELQPDFAAAHGNLGALLERQGKLDEAAVCCLRALELKPDFAAASYNLGSIREKQGRIDDALACYRQACRLAPDFVDAYLNLGPLLEKQGKLDEALTCCLHAVELAPDRSTAHNNLGGVLARGGKLDEAARCYQRAIELDPTAAEAHNNLAGVLRDQLRFDAAEACCRRAIELNPALAAAHNNLGLVLTDQHRLAEGIACCRRAIELEPGFADAHYNLGLTLLLDGQYDEGWAAYEWRWRRHGQHEPMLPVPRWNGEALEGRTILLRCEQGLGDVLHFIRYAALVKQRGAKVVAEVQPALVRLVASCPGVDEVVVKGDPLPPCNFYAHLLNLPRIFRTSAAIIPATESYLAPDALSLAAWRKELASEPLFKVGIAWQGNPEHPADNRRSIPLAHFAPLAEVPGVRLYSLQAGAGREQLADGPASIVDLGDRLGDFCHTAAIMRNFDLIIACDSSAAHLAGALGVKVWMPLAFTPDWRWLLDGEETRWYPSMRLFRQTTPGDWLDVFRRIAAELRSVV